jgi:CopA family copper-resistance protein
MIRRKTNRLSMDSERRRFIEGVAASVALGSCGILAPVLGRRAEGSPAEGLAGTEFDLSIGTAGINLTGRHGLATLVNGVLPGPLLRWREGDTVTIRVRNNLSEDTSIHWHGIVLPANMDGVPGLSFAGIAPGESYLYRFPVRQAGTYWYHSHSGFQEQTGLYGPLIIDPRHPEHFHYDREHVVMLSDWTDRDPMKLYLMLRRRSDYFNFIKPTLADFVSDSRAQGFGSALRDRAAWGRMRMNRSDRADVSGYEYTYLMNGTAPAGNWTGLFRPGERVRLRFINAAAMSYFDVRIPGLAMTVVAADGQPVHPVTVEEFRIGVAETLDVIVQPSGADAFTLFAQSMDRTGFARGTLAVRAGLSAPVPVLDRVTYLSMADMGHGMHAGHGTAAAHSVPDPSMAGPAPAIQPGGDAAMDHAAMGHGIDHAAMGHGAASSPAPDAMAQPVQGSMPAASLAAMVSHPDTEFRNPGVDMQTMAPSSRLDDPGVGLRANGRRVLSYGDLVSLYDDPDGRDPGRTIELHLTGHMERYLWSFNGVRFSAAEPLALRYGERVRIVLVNDTMMEHPIHLHGMWSDLENDAGAFQLRKHTVSMPPGTRRSYRVSADALGRWAYHCHMLYHMEAGMFREVRVDV